MTATRTSLAGTLAGLLAAGSAVAGGPLEPVAPRLFEVTIAGRAALPSRTETAGEAWLVIPLITGSRFAVIDEESFALETGEDLGPRGTAPRTHERRVVHDAVLGTTTIHVTVAGLGGGDLLWRSRFLVRTATSRADDAALARVAWPREWPEAVRIATAPEPRIESDAGIFRTIVHDATNGRPRLVAPYVAARAIVAYCARQFDVLAEPRWEVEDEWARRRRLADPEPPHPDLRVRRLLRHWPYAPVSAREAAERGEGSPAELTLVCIAALRAAGIPARVVGGIWAHDSRAEPRITWGELYLPEVGWVPFDPDRMSVEVNRRVRGFDDPWPGFGSVPDLDRMIPLTLSSITVRADPRVIAPSAPRGLAESSFTAAGHTVEGPRGVAWRVQTEVTVIGRGQSRPDGVVP